MDSRLIFLPHVLERCRDAVNKISGLLDVRERA